MNLPRSRLPIPVLVVVAVTAVAASRFLVFRLIPGVDIPNHLAVATIFKFAAQPEHYFHNFFLVDSFLKPSTFHPWFCSLPVFPTVEIGNRVFLCAYGLLLPLSLLLVLRRVGGNAWFALLSIPMIQNFNLNWGFVGFAMASPLIILTFLAGLEFLEKTRLRSALVMAALFVLLFFMHAQALLFTLILFLACAVYRHRASLLRWRANIAVILPAVFLVARWWFSQDQQPAISTAEYLAKYYTTIFVKLFTNRFFELVTLDNYFLFYGNKGVLVASLLAGSIILFTGWALIRGGSGSLRLLRSREGAPILLLVIVSLLCYFLLPHSLPGQDYIYQRFASMTLIALILAAGFVAGRRTPATVKIMMAAVCALSVVLWYGYYAEFNRENASFTSSAFPQEAPEVPASALVFDFAFRGQPLYMQFPNYHIVWNEGIITTAIVHYRFGIIRRKVGTDVLPEYNQLVGPIPRSFEPKNIDTELVVIRGQPSRRVRSALAGLTRVRTTGDWTLYRRGG